MKLLYNNVDITDRVQAVYCMHEMNAEKRADTITMRFDDADGLWSRWGPAEGDTVRVTQDGADTGKMNIHSVSVDDGYYTIRAMSMPKSGITKKSRTWEGVRFLQLGQEIASTHGLEFKNYGCTDQVYKYVRQANETDFALYSRLCMQECCQMIIYDGLLLAYNEPYMENLEATTELEAGVSGIFSYRDNWSATYGSCTVKSGEYTGTFTAPDTENTAILYPRDVCATSNAEAARFAHGILRNANKYGRSGVISQPLLAEYAAGSVLRIKTEKASSWNGTVFLHRVRHDYIDETTSLYFRGLLEGY